MNFTASALAEDSTSFTQLPIRAFTEFQCDDDVRWSLPPVDRSISLEGCKYIGSSKTPVGFYEWNRSWHENDLYLLDIRSATLVSRKSGTDKRHAVLLRNGKFLTDLTPLEMAPGLHKKFPYAIDSGGLAVEDLAFEVRGASLMLMSSPQSSSNYFHWFSFYFQTLIFLNQIKRRKNCFLLAPKLLPYQRLSIEAAGLSLSKVIEYDGFSLGLENVLIPSTSMAIQRVRPESLPLYRKVSANLTKMAPEDFPTKLYIRRGATNQRQVVNEGRIIDLLRSSGFIAVDPGSLDLSRQAKLFKGATHIVSPHGAALTNLVFCENLVSILEVFSESWMHGCYRDLCAVMNCQYFYAIGRSVPLEGVDPRERPYEIFESDIRAYLSLFERS